MAGRATKPDQIHEAAHAVVAHYLGRTVEWITTDPGSNPHGHPGGTKFEPWPDGVDMRTRYERAIIISFAGGIAQTREANDDQALVAHAERASQKDIEQAIALAKLSWPDEDERRQQLLRLIEEAERLVYRHWDEIDRVADALLLHRLLTGDQLVALLSSPDKTSPV